MQTFHQEAIPSLVICIAVAADDNYYDIQEIKREILFVHSVEISTL